MSTTTITLASELDGVKEHFIQNAPKEAVHAITTTNKDFAATSDYSQTIKVGDKLPSFTLTNAPNKEVRSQNLLADGPLLITFYSGEWCPHCNLALRAMQKHLPEIKAKGVTTVAISPELLNQGLTTTEKKSARVPRPLRRWQQVCRKIGHPFSAAGHYENQCSRNVVLISRSGMATIAWVVRLPASFLVDRTGIVRNAFVETDYTQRLEPSTALQWIDAL